MVAAHVGSLREWAATAAISWTRLKHEAGGGEHGVQNGPTRDEELIRVHATIPIAG
jgi:hypothetical protein